MGTDDLFHKRRAKRASTLSRRRAKRERYAKVLIVCEGGKTEPRYFNELKDHYRLNSANIMISGECGSDPASVVKYAKQLFQKEKDAGDPFDRVYCVFDRDTHANYRQALDIILHARPKNTYFAITSVPCFEYWFLLHFTYTCKPYRPLPDKSAGEQVLTDLKAYMPDYRKGRRGLFPELLDQLERAKQHADRALTAAGKNQTDNPSTRVHELVHFLQHIKDPK